MDFNLIWNRRVGVFVAMVVVLGLLVSDIYLKSKTSSHLDFGIKHVRRMHIFLNCIIMV